MIQRLLRLLLCLLPCASLSAQTITLHGTVTARATSQPIDSARIEIVNANDPVERYAVATNAAGAWSYAFVPLAVDRPEGLPQRFSVEQNYPNPFNPSTRIEFSTGTPGAVRLTVHNALGQLLESTSLEVGAGRHSMTWNSKGAAGVLFYTLEFGGQKITRKMLQLDGGGAGGFGALTTVGGVASRSRVSLQEAARQYLVIASRLIYMPDTAVVTLDADASVNHSLETVHSRALVFDLHNDVMEKVILGYQLGIRHTVNQSDLPRFRDGGMDAQMFAIWTDYTDSVAHPYYAYTIAMMDAFDTQVAQNAGVFVQARTADEVLAASAAGKLAGVIGVEGGHAIESSIEKLKTFYSRGARYLTITWNNPIPWAMAAADGRSTTVGLSDFGKQVIRTMDSLGMIIDVSHTGIKTISDILATTRNPIIASHSGVRALRNHYRNLSDDQIDSIAARGGVIGVVFYPTFLSSKSVATIDTVIRHIDYIRNRVGIDHVAIGSDFDGIETVPVGLEDVSKLPNLTAALLRRGYSITDVRKLLGENYLRVFRQVCK
jgi:membrane dipeptidase